MSNKMDVSVKNGSVKGKIRNEIHPKITDRTILCVSAKDDLFGLEKVNATIRKFSSINGLDLIGSLSKDQKPYVIVLFGDEANEIFVNQLQYASSICRQHDLPLIAVIRNLEHRSAEFSSKVKSLMLQHGADDCYTSKNLDPEKFLGWVDFLTLYKIASRKNSYDKVLVNQDFRLNRSKRLVDILIATTILVLLTPLLAIISLIIVLESRGPVIYRSKRAGFGYKIFDFYKFRSMRMGADKEVSSLMNKNQYKGNQNVFFKIKDDPRVTRFGLFLRNTSLDELPQLINDIKGDMSLVGNRPLPLYEADKLTKDGTAWRFLAPAGITGLWQVSKRGKENMSNDERIKLDVTYARKHSFQLDAKILLSTLPAMIQKEKV